jgi:hypothetical protein
MSALLLAAALALPGAGASSSPPVKDAALVRGMTISCQSWGWEWGSDGFGAELDDLKSLGVNWVSIHPYASIQRDGTVGARRFDPEHPPEWILRPIREAHERGMSILVIPHLAYWGSPWSWRGEIDFQDPAELERFFETYTAWIVGVARAAKDADGFSIGNETDRLVRCEAQWRALIERVRQETSARLTYAANFDAYRQVAFWDALDAIGVQAYFPLCEGADPTEEDLRRGWRDALVPMRELSRRTGKPVVCTELGYDISLEAAKRPWVSGRVRGEERGAAEKLQARCLAVALEEIGREPEWLRGAFLWKWFVGPTRHEDFLMKTDAMRAVIGRSWAR